MSLPYDYARCDGAYDSDWIARTKTLAPECADCLRRTSPGGERQSWIAPHDGEGPCPMRIGPMEAK